MPLLWISRSQQASYRPRPVDARSSALMLSVTTSPRVVRVLDTGTKKAHDWTVEQLADHFRATTKVDVLLVHKLEERTSAILSLPVYTHTHTHTHTRTTTKVKTKQVAPEPGSEVWRHRACGLCRRRCGACQPPHGSPHRTRAFGGVDLPLNLMTISTIRFLVT